MTNRSKKMIGATSRFIGVTATKNGKYQYWSARVRVDGKYKYLGNYPKTKEGEILAAKRVNEQLLKTYGETATLNEV